MAFQSLSYIQWEKNKQKPRYTQNEDVFCSSLRGKRKLEISLQSEHPKNV